MPNGFKLSDRGKPDRTFSPYSYIIASLTFRRASPVQRTVQPLKADVIIPESFVILIDPLIINSELRNSLSSSVLD